MRTLCHAVEGARRHTTRRALAVALLAAAGVVLAAVTSTGLARPVAREARPARSARTSTRVVVPVPAGGDISYAVAQVRLAGARSAPRSRGAGKDLVFAESTAGVALRATSPSWQKLRRTTHVYVAISKVAHAHSDVRNLVFFVVRRRTARAARSNGTVTFVVANGAPAVGSFWVRSVSRRGVAKVFQAPNAISTALHNWSRYLALLKVAHALRAALHPVDTHGEFRAPPRAAVAAFAAAHRTKRTKSKHPNGPWFAGQRTSRDVRAVARLIFGTLSNRMAFQAAKQSPLAEKFIAHDLDNPALAAEWSRVVGQLPLEVPDQYAADANEEGSFSKIRAPLVTRAKVAIYDTKNASSQAAIESPPDPTDNASAGQRVVVHFNGKGSVAFDSAIVTPDPGEPGPNWSDGTPLGIGCSGTCSYYFPSGTNLEINASSNGAWQGCRETGGGDDYTRPAYKCLVLVGTGNTINLYVDFKPAGNPTLSVSLPGSGTGTVTSSPPGISCPGTCSADFPLHQKVTLTATPARGSLLTKPMSGSPAACSGSALADCTVTLDNDEVVAEDFARGEVLTVGLGGTGSGSVTSSPAGISCPGTCSATLPPGAQVTLIAKSAPASSFGGFTPGSGGPCDSTGNGTCTLRMGSDRSMTVGFDSQPVSGSGTAPSSGGLDWSTLTPVGDTVGEGGKALAEQSDGEYVVAGSGSSAGSIVSKVARYLSTGELDTSFGDASGGTHTGIATLPAMLNGKTFFAEAVGIQPVSGDIVVAGTLEDPNNLYAGGDFGVVRLTPAGVLDTTFAGGAHGGVADTALGTAGSDGVSSLVIDPASGEIYVGGSANSGSDFAIAAYDSDGNAEPTSTFGTNGQVLTPVTGGGAINALALDGTNLVAAGGANGEAAVMRYASDGTPTTGFTSGPVTVSLGGAYSLAYSVLVRSDHSVVIGGSGSYGTDCLALAHFGSTGVQDTSFGGAAGGVPHQCVGDDSWANAIAQTADGNYIYATGGSYDNSTYVTTVVLARFSGSGVLDTGFGSSGIFTNNPDTGGSTEPHALTLDGTSAILAGESYDTGASQTIYFTIERYG